MAGLGALNPLSSLSSIDTAISAVSPEAGAVIAGANAGAAVSGAPTSGGLFGVTLGRVVIILLGLLLIAAGIFSFDKTRELVVEAGRTAAEAA